MTAMVQILKHDAFGNIRRLLIDDVPYFVGKDVAVALGFKGKGANNALKAHVDDEDKGVTEIMTPGGKQAMTVINESGVYSLILSSKLPAAKKFKRWVTNEVLPSIRKTGSYSVDKDIQAVIKARIEGKKLRRDETDAIKIFIDYARAQGCSEDDGFFYGKISVFCNLGVGLPPKGGRNGGTKEQLSALGVLEGITVKNVLLHGMAEGLNWTQILAKVQLEIQKYIDVVFQGRLLTPASQDVAVAGS